MCVRAARWVVGLVAMAAAFGAQAGLFGSDSASADCMKKKSEAWCTLDAAGMARAGLKDVERSQIDKALGTSDKVGAWWYGGAVAGLQSGFFRPAPGLSAGAESGLLLLGLIFSNQFPAAYGWNGVFGWMPLELAKNEDEAKTLVAKTLNDAMKKLFAKYTMELAWEPDERADDVYTVEPKGRPVFILRGGDCDQKACRLTVFNRGGSVERTKRPAWLGGGEAWGVGTTHGHRLAAFSPWQLTVDGVDMTASYLPELSKELPEWAYIWVSPEVTRAWGKVNTGQRVPGIYKKGEFRAMVFPELPAQEQQ